MDATYTFTLAEDESTGGPLARRPKHEGTLTLAYEPIDDLTTDLSVRAKGEPMTAQRHAIWVGLPFMILKPLTKLTRSQRSMDVWKTFSTKTITKHRLTAQVGVQPTLVCVQHSEARDDTIYNYRKKRAWAGWKFSLLRPVKRTFLTILSQRF